MVDFYVGAEGRVEGTYVNPVDVDPVLLMPARPPQRDVLVEGIAAHPQIRLTHFVAEALLQTENAPDLLRVPQLNDVVPLLVLAVVLGVLLLHVGYVVLHDLKHIIVGSPLGNPNQKLKAKLL